MVAFVLPIPRAAFSQPEARMEAERVKLARSALRTSHKIRHHREAYPPPTAAPWIAR